MSIVVASLEAQLVAPFADAVALAVLQPRSIEPVGFRALAAGGFAIWLACSLAVIVLHWATRDASWVDRIWSVFPPLLAVYAALNGYGGARTWLLAGLICIWGVRLTFNFWRRGGYAGYEDYRWEALRKSRILRSTVAWELFAIFFIALYQLFLLLLITIPVFLVAANTRQEIRPVEWALALAFMTFVLLETIADQQQWNFQEGKKRYLENEGKRRRASSSANSHEADAYRRGFCNSGLFRYSRHPNFFAEQMVWWVVFFYGAASVGTLRHWSICGAVLLSLLFQGSTWFTESLSVSRHPLYARYQRTTSRLIPLPSTGDIAR